MSERETTYLWLQLMNTQQQIHDACQHSWQSCPVDMRYQQEWERLRDFTDTTVSNIEALFDRLYTGVGAPDQERTLVGQIAAALEYIVPTAAALLDGYIIDLANSPDDHGPCPLHERARQFISTQMGE